MDSSVSMNGTEPLRLFGSKLKCMEGVRRNSLIYLLVYLIAHGWEANMLINLGDITCIGFGRGGGSNRVSALNYHELWASLISKWFGVSGNTF